MVYFKTREVLFKGGLHLRALKRVGCRILSRLIVRVWGKQGACHEAKRKRKSGKRKNSKRSFKRLCLEISFSWFKVSAFEETLISKSVPLSLKSLGVSLWVGLSLTLGRFHWVIKRIACLV